MSLNASRIMVAGSGGFLGKHVVSQLQRAYPLAELLTPLRSELDLSDQSAVREYWDKEKPDFLIHVAAFARGLGGNLEAKEHAFLSNEAVIRSALLAALEFGVKGVVFCGTVAEYGFPYVELPLREEHLLIGPPHAGEKYYGLAKRNADNYLQAIGDRWSATISHALLTNLYGPGDRYDTNSGHVVASMISKFSSAVSQKSKEVTLWGVPETTRDFLYVEDAARALIELVGLNGGHVNIATGRECTMLRLAETIATATGFSGEIHWDSSMPIGIERRSIDITKISAFTEIDFLGIETGIPRTVTYESVQGQRDA